MNVKNKIVALVMSFVICFCTVSSSFANDKERINNIQPLVFDGGVISAPMLAVVSTVAVASGIAINNVDDIYNMGRMFYDKYQNNLEQINMVFDTCVSIGVNNVVSVGKEFLDYVKDFLDDFKDVNEDYEFYGYFGLMPVYEAYAKNFGAYIKHTLNLSVGRSFDIGHGIKIDVPFGNIGEYVKLKITHNDETISRNDWAKIEDDGKVHLYGVLNNKTGGGFQICNYSSMLALTFDSSLVYGNVSSNPTTTDYNWDSVSDRLKEDKLDISVPKDLSSLVGAKDVFSPSYELSDGTVLLPGISNPSIDVSEGTFVGSSSANPSVPNDNIFTNVKDFIISLVVPSDTFWTDTFNSFRDNFSKNFPMLDMSKFDSLVVGGKPFPNLYAYGSKIVDGDVINSIVDWLRPIIAGFIMICLMFFNYRKIYKLIRNTEPFGSIAQGSSDFRTGLSSPPINNGLDSNPMGNLRDTLFDMRNEILRRENLK